MKRTLLNISFFLLSASAFAQVPETLNDSIKNDSITFQNEMEEVVVIGYGTRKAGAITGSVSQIKAADIVRTPAQSAIQAIQGKAAGVNIVTNDEPGANPTIRIRGLGTITGARDPLYVIDGIETSGLNGINPNDIATIDILKDASSLAIYGQKGANGVVIITTKKGKQGEIKISYDGYFGQKFIQRDVEMADSYRYAYYSNSALGSSSYFNFNQPYNTNWLDEITRTGEVMSNSVSLSGASENTSYYFSASNYKERGILNGTSFERNNVLMKNEFRMLDGRLKVSPFVNLSIARNSPKPLSAFTNAYKQAPIVPVMFPNGKWGAPIRNADTGLVDANGSDRFNTVANPVAQLNYFNEQNKNVTLIGSVNAELKLLDELKFTSNFGATADWAKGYTFTPVRDIWLSQNPAEDVEGYIAAFPKNPAINTLAQRRYTSYRWNWDNYLTYSKLFGNHNVSLTAGMSRSTTNISEFLNGTRQDVPEQSNYWSFEFATYQGTTENPVLPSATVQNENSTPIVSIAYFARGEYDYKGKYLLSGVLRREGISSFQQGKQWDVFPSVSAGWVISSENFMKDVKLINTLKLRGGYGEVGNGYGSYPLNQLVFDPNRNYTFGDGRIVNPGSDVPYQVDPNLTWEVMKEYDFGLDFAMLDNRFSGSFDVYSRKSERLILPISLPPVLSPGLVYLNSGTVSNKGAEATLKWRDNIGEDFTYSIGGNFSYNKNELEDVNNIFFGQQQGGSLGNGEVTKQVLVGQPLGSFYVYDYAYGNDGYFTYSDERIVAGSYLPKYTYGFNVSVNYKNVDLSVDAYGVGGNKIYNGKKAQRQGNENIENNILDSFWTPSTPNAQNPRPFNDRPLPSTYYIEDGSYLRINNITLGYTLPEIIKGLDRARIYVTAVNPFLFTEYSGYSPEVVGADNGNPLGTAGIELDAYPTNRTFLFGLNIGL